MRQGGEQRLQPWGIDLAALLGKAGTGGLNGRQRRRKLKIASDCICAAVGQQHTDIEETILIFSTSLASEALARK